MYVLIFISFVVLGAVLGVVSFLRKPLKEDSAMSDPIKQVVKPDFGPARNNVIHDIIVANTHLIADKLLGILAYILGNEDDSGLTSIVITEQYPKNQDMENVLSRFHPDSKAMIVNLEGHLELAKDVMKEPNGYMAIWPYLWVQVIRSFFHELHHAHTFADADDIYSVDTNSGDFEEKAEAWCNEEIIQLAKVIDIEPPALEEFPYYTNEMFQILKSITDGDSNEDWADRQFTMLAESLSFFKPGVDGKSDPIRCTTLRDYFKMVAADEDPLWEKPVPGMAAMAVADVAAVIPPVKIEPAVTETATATEEPVASIVTTPDLSAAGIAVVRAHAYADTSEPEFVAEEMEGLAFDPNEGVEIHDEDGNIAPTAQPLIAPTPVKPAVAAQPVFQMPVNPAVATPQPTPGGAVAITLQLPGGATTLPAGPTPTAPLKQLVPHNLSTPEILDCLQNILVRLYSHIFCKCGWNPAAGGRGFTTPTGVLQPVNLADIPNVDKLLHGYESKEVNGRVTDMPFQGTVAGLTMKDGQLPGYHLHFNLGGMLEKRSFLPQDMQKTDANGNFKDWSKKAQAGHMMAMMLDAGGVVVKIATAPGGQTMYEFDPFKRFV